MSAFHRFDLELNAGHTDSNKNDISRRQIALDDQIKLKKI